MRYYSLSQFTIVERADACATGSINHIVTPEQINQPGTYAVLYLSFLLPRHRFIARCNYAITAGDVLLQELECRE